MGDPYGFIECVPRELGAKAARGEVAAGPLPLVDYFRLEATFERVGRFGIAVRGRGRSAILFARRPLRQLDHALIAVTEETSTTFCLLRLLLEERYRLRPASYERGQRQDADALLLIGDAALQFQQANTSYPFEIDVAFEWWLWQHLPFVFAVWAIRKDATEGFKTQLERAMSRSLGINTRQLELIAREYSMTLGVPSASLHAYLSNFIYRLSEPEEEAISRFRTLLDASHLL